MNAKLCKQLRRVARELTVGMPERRLMAKELPGGIVLAVNDPQSTRGVYRALKKTART